MRKIEGIIFDWAGTTVDFGCFAPVNVFVEIFKEAGVEITMAEAREPMGMLKIDHIRAILQMSRVEALWTTKYGEKPNEADVQRLYAHFEPMLLSTLTMYTQPIDGVVDTIKVLRESGLKIGSTTGYTDSMMAIVTKGAKDKGYAPDYWITPDATESYGRPYPYMIYRNMENLKLTTPSHVVKVGDTVSDIKEGNNAQVWSVGILIGSSEMGLDQEAYTALSEKEKQVLLEETRKSFEKAGADFTIETMTELPALIKHINTLLECGKKPNGN